MMLGNDNNNKLELTTGTNTKLSLTNSGTTYDISSNSALSTTEFSHIVCIIEDNSMNLHIDNTLVGSLAVTPYALNTFFTSRIILSHVIYQMEIYLKVKWHISRLGWIIHYYQRIEISDLYEIKQSQNQSQNQNQYQSQNQSQSHYQNQSQNQYQSQSQNQYQSQSQNQYQNQSQSQYQNQNQSQSQYQNQSQSHYQNQNLNQSQYQNRT